MKVCVTGLRGIPGVMGGVETHCEELLPRIVALDPGIEIEVCCRAPYVDPAMTSFRHVALTPLYSPTGRVSEALVSTLVGILHARRRGADAVHIHAVGPALFAPLARLLGLGVLLTHHGADYDREKWGRGARLMLKLGEWLGVRSADRVVCVSPSLAARMKARYPARAERVEFIPNGVSTMPPSPQSDAEVLDELALIAGNYVICVARLVPEKGIHILVEAFRRSNDTRTLVIAGAGRKDDRYAQDLLAGAEIGAEPRIRFLGMVSRARLGVLLRNAALFVLPSFHEGLPIAALEALACGCPVLLSDIQPNLDLDLPPGRYFPVGDVAALAARLADHAEAREAKGLLPDSLMDWDEVATRTAATYRKLKGRRRHRHALTHAN
ncbi:MAG: glycosyltransferase family 4 protein [Novosphingobium sp.]|nr:glycosyltransferase family 4 protein [Novosphingobium sp.]